MSKRQVSILTHLNDEKADQVKELKGQIQALQEKIVELKQCVDSLRCQNLLLLDFKRNFEGA